MDVKEAKARRKAALDTPTNLSSNATNDISGALNALLADMFALYLKTKNFHWHMSGPHFRDYHLLLDEQGDADLRIPPTTSPSGRARSAAPPCARSATSPACSALLDNDADFVTPLDMLAELRDDNKAPDPAHARDCTTCATSTATSPPRACSRTGSTRPSGASGSCSRPAAPS